MRWCIDGSIHYCPYSSFNRCDVSPLRASSGEEGPLSCTGKTTDLLRKTWTSPPEEALRGETSQRLTEDYGQ